MKEKLWSGRFSESTNKLVDNFTASMPFDWKLYKYDILGSIAHAGMLAKTGIIKKQRQTRLSMGLRQLKRRLMLTSLNSP